MGQIYLLLYHLDPALVKYIYHDHRKHHHHIIIRHELGLNKPVSPSSNFLFKRLQSRLCPIGPQFILIFGFMFYVHCACRLNHKVQLAL